MNRRQRTACRTRRFAFFGLLCLLLTWMPPAPPAVHHPVMPERDALLQAVCVRVAYGDTAWFSWPGEKERLVRILQMDAPETVHPDLPPEPFGREASAQAVRMLRGKTVWLEPDTRAFDPYGRALYHVWLSDGTLFGLSMVGEGYARALVIPPNDKYAQAFEAAQASAQARRAGLWGLSE